MRPRNLTIVALVVAALGAGALAACELNPQPLPPSDPNDLSPGGSELDDASTGGGFGSDAGAVPTNGSDAGADGGADTRGDGGEAGDGGDGGDGGDASPEASISG